MDLTTYLNRLRGKSDQEKRQIAFGYAIGVTAVIFIIWVISLAISLGNLGQSLPAPATPAPISAMAASPALASPSWFDQAVTGTADFIDSVGRGVSIAVNKLKTNFK